MKKLGFLILVCVIFSVTACTPTVVATESSTSTTAAPQQANQPMRGGMSATTTETPAFADVAYANVSAAQKMDIYLPEGDGPFPVVILVHGGAFLMGDKAAGDATTGLSQLLSKGYAAVSLNYRLSGEALAPAQIQDIKAAVRFLRANSATYNLNTEKIGAWGGSAGGSLVSLLGTSCGIEELEGADLGNAEESSCVQAVVDWFGPIDFLQMDNQFSGTNCPATHDAADSPESLLVGGPIQENIEAVNLVNAMTYITPDDAAFFIQHGTADCNVPPQQSQDFYSALIKVLDVQNVTFESIEGAGHGGSQFSDTANLEKVIAFFDMHLK